MKKYILSALVVFSFATYILFQKISGTGNTIVVKQNNTNTQANTSTEVANTITTSNLAPAPVSVKVTTPAPKPANTGQYKDGQYTGASIDAYYGNIQVKAVVFGGRLSDVQFLDYPQDRNYSRTVNGYAMPILRSEAIKAQSSNVDTVSGATDSSGAFRQSLESALSQARNS